MIDVHMLLKKLRRVEDDLENLKSVSSQAELLESMQRFGDSAHDLMSQAAKRQHELKDPAMRDDLGMISHKKGPTTIFGHKHKIKNFIKRFDIFFTEK